MSNRAELVFVLREEAAPNVAVGAAAANPRPQQTAQPGQAAGAAAPGFSTPKPPSAAEATQQQQNAELARAVKETFAERTARLDAERRAGDAVIAERRAAGKAKWDEFHRTGRLPGAAASQPPAIKAPPVIVRPIPEAQRVVPEAARVSARGVRFAALRQRAARRKRFRQAGAAAGARFGPTAARLAGRAAAAVGGLSSGAVVGIAAAGAAIAGVGIAAAGTVLAVKKLGEIAATAARDLEKFAQFSGEAAASLARIELRRLQMDITRAREIGGQSGQFRELTQRFSLIAERIYLLVEKASLHLVVPLLEGVMSGLTALAEWLEKSGLTEFVPFGEEIKRALGDIRRLNEGQANLPAEADILGLFRNLPPLGVEWNGKRFSPQEGAPEAIDTHFAGPMPVLGGI